MQNRTTSQNELQERAIFSMPVSREMGTNLDRVVVEMGGIADGTGENVEARQGVCFTNHTQLSNNNIPYINPRYRKVIESEDESEIIFEDMPDIPIEKKIIIKNTDVRNTNTDSPISFDTNNTGQSEILEDLGEPLPDDEEVVLLVPKKDDTVIEDDETDIEVATMQDKDIKQVLEGVQEEFKNIPISPVNGKFEISQEYLDRIQRKVDVASRIYAKKYALKRLSKTLRNIGKLSDGIKTMKKGVIYDTPPSLEANMKLIEILKDNTLIDLGGKGKKTTLSEHLKINAKTGDKSSSRKITVTNI